MVGQHPEVEVIELKRERKLFTNLKIKRERERHREREGEREKRKSNTSLKMYIVIFILSTFIDEIVKYQNNLPFSNIILKLMFEIAHKNRLDYIHFI